MCKTEIVIELFWGEMSQLKYNTELIIFLPQTIYCSTHFCHKDSDLKEKFTAYLYYDQENPRYVSPIINIC